MKIPREFAVRLADSKNIVTKARLDILLENTNGSSYSPLFAAGVSGDYLNRDVCFVQSLKTRRRIKTITQVLSCEGLPVIEAKIEYRV